MPQKSLSSQLAITIFTLNTLILVIALVSVNLLVDDIEHSILQLELNNEAEYFKKQITSPTDMQRWHTARLDVYFLPQGMDDNGLPELLRNRSAPFIGELYNNGTTILLRVDPLITPPGKLYLAQDISVLESREVLITFTLIGVGIILMIVGLLVSWLTGRALTSPLKRLGHDILRAEPSRSTKHIDGDYRYLEFENIAASFNRFLETMDQYIQREKSFVRLASHELRTPLAVISGALDVMEQRNLLSEADRRTLARIRHATEIMREDIDGLLEIARGARQLQIHQAVDIGTTLAGCIRELESSMPVHANRILLTTLNETPVIRHANLALVRMLFRNLLQNSLRHTTADVKVTLNDRAVIIRDFDQGLPDAVILRLKEHGNISAMSPLTSDPIQESSLGLLIVQLICAQLAWHMAVTHSGSDGTEIVIVMDSLASRAS